MRRSFEGGVQSGAALFKKIFYLWIMSRTFNNKINKF
jgi:hypothetical protein